MKRGELREEILDGCPESFIDDLTNSIDKIEGLMSNIVSNLSIDSISEIGCIEEAHTLANDLSEALY